jgi:hypothetical protein
MTDPRNIAHDKKVEQEKKNHGIPGAHERTSLGKKQPHDSPTADHGADADEIVDKTESGQEP